MMPARPKSPGGSQPDDTGPRTIRLSSLFTSAADRAALEATLPFADRSIFVAPDGRRYRFESIPEGADSSATTTVADPSPDSPTTRISLPSQAAPPPSCGALIATTAPRSDRAFSDDASVPWSSLSGGLNLRSSPEPIHNTLPPVGNDETTPQQPGRDMAETITQTPVMGFAAAALYFASDGGVLAAETLTDGHSALDLPIPESPQLSPGSLSRRSTVDIPPDETRYTNPSYDRLYAQISESADARRRSSHQSASASPTPQLPSLLEDSIPISRDVIRSFPSPRLPYEHPSSSYPTYPIPTYGAHDGRLAVNGGEEPFDTQTPIVVYPSPQPSTTSSRSDRASAGRDNVLPGEDVLYDG